MNNLLCRLGLHKWSQWRCYSPSSAFEVVFHLGKQARRCEHCGLLQSQSIPYVPIDEPEVGDADEPPV